MASAQTEYDWERNYVEPKAQGFLSREECLAYVSRSAKMARIETPKVRFAKAASMPCRAVPAKWEIVIADWGRTPVTVLHEMAHLAAVRSMAPGEDGHGPTFLAWACAFYSVFLGLDHDYLVRTAAALGMPVARIPFSSTGPVPAKGFSDVEF